jgi:hypothetical protein
VSAKGVVVHKAVFKAVHIMVIVVKDVV